MADYHQQWEDYKRRRNRLLLGFFGYIPITFAFGLVVKRLLDVDWPVLVFAIAWMVLAANAGLRFQTFPCPRCGQAFFSYNIIGRRCAHCTLPKYQSVA